MSDVFVRKFLNLFMSRVIYYNMCFNPTTGYGFIMEKRVKS